MDSKQLAVDWLVEKIKLAKPDLKFDALIREAKEMEKEQIIDAISKGWDYYEDGKVRWMGEQYYNETYNK
jgi:hypothetical protein